MLTHYFRMMLRKRPVFTAINLTGLVLGMTSCLLILKYVQYERNYDRQTPYAADIWRVFNQTLNGETVTTQDANSHSATGPVLKADVADVVDFARLYNRGEASVTIQVGQQAYELPHFFCTDQGFVRMFPPKVIEGHLDGVLETPGGAIMSQSAARKVFGEKSAVGQSFRINGSMCGGDYTVKAVVADPPTNTHLKYSLLTSVANRYANGHEDNFESYWDYTYIQLKPGSTPDQVRRRLAEINAQFLQKEGIRLEVQPYRDIHLHSNLTYEIEPNGNARTVELLQLVALFILGIAFINYINLTTALAGERAREVGIRKSIGATKTALMRQFFTENFLLSGVAWFGSLLLLRVSLPWFGLFIDRPLDQINYADEWQFWGQTAAFFGGMALVAGIYPALMLSRFAPVQALRGHFHGGGSRLRQVLVVTQFAFSIALIISLIVVRQQVHFLKNHDLGLSLDQKIAIKSQAVERNDTLGRRNLALFKTTCGQLANVERLTASSIVPGLGTNAISGSNRPIHWVKKADFAKITSYFIETDSAFFGVYGVKILAGKPQLFPDRQRQYQHVTINKAMLEALGFPNAESAIGEQLAYENAENDAKTTIMAVVDNFHIESLKVPAKPTLYYCLPPEGLDYLTMTINAGQAEQTLSLLQAAWSRIYPGQLFRYWFLDAHFAQQYRSETQLTRIFGLFSALAIVISCLGLFGLVAYNTERRRKEIGIRKVLGARVSSIITLLARDSMRLVLWALVVAAPVAGYLMQQWLQDFAHRIELRWWMFLAAGVIAAVIALATVGVQAARAALANPVRSLQRE
jgi:putative ABC transport system permease protein